MSETPREKLDQAFTHREESLGKAIVWNMEIEAAWPAIAAVLDAAGDLWENGDTEGAAERFYALGAALARLNEPAP